LFLIFKLAGLDATADNFNDYLSYLTVVPRYVLIVFIVSFERQMFFEKYLKLLNELRPADNLYLIANKHEPGDADTLEVFEQNFAGKLYHRERRRKRAADCFTECFAELLLQLSVEEKEVTFWGLQLQ